jgi:hypothetical protein
MHNEWGLELQHLNPTGVLHIVGFVTVCEAFLGMEPHVNFFWLFFSGRAMTTGNSSSGIPESVSSRTFLGGKGMPRCSSSPSYPRILIAPGSRLSSLGSWSRATYSSPRR